MSITFPFRLLLLFCLMAIQLQAQNAASNILLDLEKLQHFRRVLYIAAHPDDENTRAIAWFSKGRHAHTAYLSLTRGDGGQNLIGPELGPALGLIRSHELLQAREIDGGLQFFTRALDFGYSKTPTESFDFWGKREILADVVFVIRQFKPDVIVTRFPPDKRAGHGHHTASAMLAIEAMDLAANKSAFPEQLSIVETHQTQAVYWNTSRWWVGGLDTVAPVDPKIFDADIGGYSPILGVNYTELGSLARSQHKSQGFGVSIDRGLSMEYFENLAGKTYDKDFWEKENLTWDAFAGPAIAFQVEQVCSNFNPRQPQLSVAALVDLYNAIQVLPESFWKKEKSQLVQNLILKCAGVYLDARTPSFAAPARSQIEIDVNVMARSGVPVKWKQVAINAASTNLNLDLENNIRAKATLAVQLPDTITNPYWLAQPAFGGRYNVAAGPLVGKPKNDPALTAVVELEIFGSLFKINVPVVHIWSDRVNGEQQRDFLITPQATANFDAENYVFAQQKPQQVGVRVKAFEARYSTQISLDVPAGWQVTPATIPLTIRNAFEEQVVYFEVTPPNAESQGTLRPRLSNQPRTWAFKELRYEHLPILNWFETAEAPIVRVMTQIHAGKVAYIHGAGDDVDRAIKQMGFEVEVLDERAIAKTDLAQYKAIVLGIRAYNTNQWLPAYHQKFLDYIQQGGNMVVQYNTATQDLITNEIGPYKFRIARDRVTEENAVPKLITPNHPIWNTPNRIAAQDFNGWVQERGLYFADEWAPELMPMISWSDKDEPARSGGLLFGRYGKGSFVYTGISFFRQMPAGVPGPYRILANMLSYEGE